MLRDQTRALAEDVHEVMHRFDRIRPEHAPDFRVRMLPRLRAKWEQDGVPPDAIDWQIACISVALMRRERGLRGSPGIEQLLRALETEDLRLFQDLILRP